MSSKAQIKIINDQVRELIKSDFPNLTFNFEYNLYHNNFSAIENVFPKELYASILNNEHYLGIYGCDEALLEFVDLIYKDLVIGKGINESQIILIGSSPDYELLIRERSTYYNKTPIGLYYVSVFEHQQKQLFLWYMTGIDSKTILDKPVTYSSSLESSSFKKKFLCFNRRWKEHRFAICSLLYSKNLFKDGYISFSSTPVNSDDIYYGNPNSFDLFFKDTCENYESIKNILQQGYDFKHTLPLVIDNKNFETYFAFETNHRPLKRYFKETYFSLVNETYFDRGNVRFLTEKIFKPIMHKHPFVLVSAPHSLQLLRDQGYQTFDGVIDESYDNELDDCKRLLKVVDEVERLCNLNEQELLEFRQKCLPIVEYNYKVFFDKNTKVTRLI